LRLRLEYLLGLFIGRKLAHLGAPSFQGAKSARVSEVEAAVAVSALLSAGIGYRRR
jgi:hypothetical protein